MEGQDSRNVKQVDGVRLEYDFSSAKEEAQTGLEVGAEQASVQAHAPKDGRVAEVAIFFL